ncbi:TPA: hypothetical protein DEP58_05470 [Patescibacteria group bacterium]|nr:MAG: Blue (Type 1) copper protein [Parcubacteria group bacterium GW2011_GWD2_42_14]HCC05715.1 hypothetical protein [Patescibacteria group bacterium]
MNNNILWIIVIIILVAAGLWFLTSPSDTTTRVPSTTQTPTTTQTAPVTTQTTAPTTTRTPSSQTQTSNKVVFNIKGSNYSFDQDELSVTEGDTVTINFESTDNAHDWTIDEFNASTKQVNVGVPSSVTFVADKVGEFEYYCSVDNHRAMGMVGTLTVVAKR